MNGSATYPATCQEYFDRGTRNNGTYKIRPSLDLHSYHVECIFTDKEGFTLLRPIDWKQSGYIFPGNKSERCRDADCFTKMIRYGVNKAQIKVTNPIEDINYNNYNMLKFHKKNNKWTI